VAKKRRQGTKTASERYHDRVARKYDGMYEGSRYWQFYRDLTWHTIKPYLQGETGRRALDVGCGTGYWGLRLAKSGLSVIFSDISGQMVERARELVKAAGLLESCSFVKADLENLEGIDDASISLLVAQGDPLSCCERPKRGVKAMHRVLKASGIAVVSVDSLYGGSIFFLERGDIKGLKRYLSTGRTVWQTERESERFPLKAFSANELEGLFENAGFEVLKVLGKPVLPLRRFSSLLENPDTYRSLLRTELSLQSKRELVGSASHLEIVVRKRD